MAKTFVLVLGSILALACGGSGTASRSAASGTASPPSASGVAPPEPLGASIVACGEGVDGDHLLALVAWLGGETMVAVGPNALVPVPPGELQDAVAAVLAATERRQIRQDGATFVVSEGMVLEPGAAEPIGPNGPEVNLLLTGASVAAVVELLGEVIEVPVEAETDARVTVVATNVSIGRVLGLVRAATGVDITRGDTLRVTGEGRSAMVREVPPQLHLAAIVRHEEVPWLLLSDGRILRDGEGLGMHPVAGGLVRLEVSGPETVAITGLGASAEATLCEPIVIAPPEDLALVEAPPAGRAVAHAWPPFRGPIGERGPATLHVELVDEVAGRARVRLETEEGSIDAPLPLLIDELEAIYLLDADDDHALEILLVGDWATGHGPNPMAVFPQAILVDHRPGTEHPLWVTVEPRFRDVRSAWDVSAALGAGSAAAPMRLVFPAPR